MTLLQRSDDPKTEPEETASSRVQVFVLPADGTSPRTEFLPTIDTITQVDSLPVNLSGEKKARYEYLKGLLAGAGKEFPHVINPSSQTSSGPARRDDTAQANANDPVMANSKVTLPDPCHGHWSADAWEKRGVFGRGYIHFLVTHLKEGLHPNPWTNGNYFGDVFVLTLSGTTGPDGSLVLKDIFLDAQATPELESKLLQNVTASFQG